MMLRTRVSRLGYRYRKSTVIHRLAFPENRNRYPKPTSPLHFFGSSIQSNPSTYRAVMRFLDHVVRQFHFAGEAAVVDFHQVDAQPLLSASGRRE
jgi:hypothetical protein